MPEAKVDDAFFDVLRIFSVAAQECGISWLVVGATARIMLLEKVYGWPRGLGTQDTDFAVQVDSWEHYQFLCKRLGCESSTDSSRQFSKRFRTRQGMLFDLLPYGGVEEGNKQIFWPPDRDYLMTVRGFSGAAMDAVVVRINNALNVPVASPAGLCALKLFAWEERHAQETGRDAKDIAYLFGNIEKLIPPEQLFAQHESVLEAMDYDPQLSALGVFGSRVASLLESQETEFLQGFLSDHVKESADSLLIRELNKYLPSHELERVAVMIVAFVHGLNSVKRETLK